MAQELGDGVELQGSDQASPPEINTSVAHPARRYDYWLGGKDNYPADRASGDAVEAAFPSIRIAATENRRFLVRAVRFLASELGIRQFLDIGTGIPTSPNVHEVAQSIAPDSRIVYVDNDPIVLAHARALLKSHPEGATAYIDADVRESSEIFQDPALLRTLDLSRPVALMLVSILHFIPEEADPYGTVARLVGAMPPGSYLVISQGTFDFVPAAKLTGYLELARPSGPAEFHPRTRADFARFFAGTELVPPGIVPVSEWRAEEEPQPRPSAADTIMYAAVGRIG
ncbi:MAG TPA: SAM-dependent methyltransferase [Actinomycetes bacterium]|nr:SAM-dependent methyltransferase [Actinomycetes bacterium]